MNTDNVKQLCEEALRRLATALEQGQSDALKTYLATMARFHKYSWGNVLLIFTQKPNASHVAGFQTWRKLNRSVRKREKGIAIFAPMQKQIWPLPRHEPSAYQDSAFAFETEPHGCPRIVAEDVSTSGYQIAGAILMTLILIVLHRRSRKVQNPDDVQNG